MKIRTRLVLAFCIIIFVPIITVLTAYILVMYSHIKSDAILKIQENVNALSADVIVSAALILILTAIILILWIYKAFVPQIRKLGEAADLIREGDLDFTIEENGVDELSELCNTFEQMRIRLKVSAEERLEDEQRQRRLISNIAHDLKTPITAIKGYSEGLIDGIADTRHKQEEYVRTIYNKAVEMDNLIDELTFISNLDTKRIPYNFRKTSISSYFQDSTCDLGMDLSHHNIQLLYTDYTEGDIYAIIDPEQLSRVINNIINNSVKYKKENEDLIIALAIYDNRQFVQVDITDNGIGISEEDLPHIFDRMYRADPSRSNAAWGSGIGLSIVKTIIEDHGGNVWATSTLGEGTKMSFTLRKYMDGGGNKE